MKKRKSKRETDMRRREPIDAEKARYKRALLELRWMINREDLRIGISLFEGDLFAVIKRALRSR